MTKQKTITQETNALTVLGTLIVTIGVIVAIGSIIYAVYAYSTIVSTYDLNEAGTAVWNWGIVSVILLIIGKIIKSVGKSQLKNKKEKKRLEEEGGTQTTLLHNFNSTTTVQPSALKEEVVEEEEPRIKKDNSSSITVTENGITYIKD